MCLEVKSWSRIHFLGASPTILKANKNRTHPGLQHTRSMCPEIRDYRAEGFWIGAGFVISTHTHGHAQSNSAAQSVVS